MAAPMFGVIVAGRLVQTDFQPVSENQFLITIPEADSINHIVVFLTGSQQFADGFGGAVYFCWPDESGPPSWQLLGHISNLKPSAVFKLSKLKPNGMSMGISWPCNPQMQFGMGPHQVAHNAQIGISVEPLNQIQQQTPAATSEASLLPTQLECQQKMLQNFFDYAASFAVDPSVIQVAGSKEQFVPLSAIQNWFVTFQRRMQNNPGFFMK